MQFSTTSELAILAALVLALCAAISIAAFALGKLLTIQKQASQVSHLALFASIFALNKAEAVEKSKVLTRVVERWHPSTPIDKATRDELTSYEQEIQDLFSVGDFLSERKDRARTEAPLNNVDPKSLV